MALDANRIGRVRRTNLTSQVMDSVKQYIIENNLAPGSRLPTEKELTATLGVSRNILREALKSLEAVGLIEIRVGDGMYVSDFDYSCVMNHISFAISRSKQEMKHFMHARLVIEVGAIFYIIQQITDEDIKKLEENLARFESTQSVEEGAKIDLEFHQMLLSIADNPILSEFGMFLGRFFMEAHHFVGFDRKTFTSEGHRNLIYALKKRNPKQAREVIRAHILSWDADLTT